MTLSRTSVAAAIWACAPPRECPVIVSLWAQIKEIERIVWKKYKIEGVKAIENFFEPSLSACGHKVHIPVIERIVWKRYKIERVKAIGNFFETSYVWELKLQKHWIKMVKGEGQLKKLILIARNKQDVLSKWRDGTWPHICRLIHHQHQHSWRILVHVN